MDEITNHIPSPVLWTHRNNNQDVQTPAAMNCPLEGHPAASSPSSHQTVDLHFLAKLPAVEALDRFKVGELGMAE
jgi:hypothetical protein